MINYNSVRPNGEPLRTFGGTASGHEALKTVLEKTTKILLKDNNGYKKLRPIEAMDIANIIAEGIVVGGVRRSAQMAFIDLTMMKC
jgi:ribonucleoside-diphosphate reductase alpha chain/ribonucleoside-triphosphate reductase